MDSYSIYCDINKQNVALAGINLYVNHWLLGTLFLALFLNSGCLLLSASIGLSFLWLFKVHFILGVALGLKY